jgi:hypothetical protein
MTSKQEMEEKLEILFAENAKRNKDATTFAQFAKSEASGVHDRFAQINKATVTGSQPFVSYPRLPETSPSNQAAIVPQEPPYDGDMSTPIVGEVWEVEKNLRDSPSRIEGEALQGATSASPSTSLAGDSVAPFAGALTPAASSGRVVEPPAILIRKRWRRSL